MIPYSCQEDDTNANNGQQQENIPDAFSEYFGNEISRDFLGTVIDKNHNPIEGVIITIGSETVMTDSNDIFIIRDASVNECFGYIKAEKAGYCSADGSFGVGFDLTQCLDVNIWNDIIYHFTAFGEVGEYIDINFSGWYEDSNGNPHTITSVVHVIRDN
ncbi:hypothetical protein [Winogradskyella sp.]|uniref:hypothetical protein n=1 Tax=Winogradskyella sp. TaxID=1883156 RepID=UPI00262FEBB3|nr:hypothetical protein [Winogradskyella sp.]